LLSSALIEHSTVVKHKRAVRSSSDVDANYRACFTRPENWALRSQVRLVHVDDTVRTLIGLFDELVHTYVPACRRLTAASQVNEALPQKSEEVRGPHWMPTELWQFKRQPSERSLYTVLDVTLDMGQHLSASAVLCEARLVGGGLQKLILSENTIFEGHAPRTILSLPTGLDILEGVLGGCKVLIWRRINEELGNGNV
jgi:hypothetical protein